MPVKLFLIKLRLVILALVLGSASIARADYMGMFNAANSAAINIAGTTAVNSAIGSAARNRRLKKEQGSLSVKRNPASLLYEPSSAMSEQLRERFWNQIKEQNPQAATVIDTQLKYQDVLGKFKDNVSPYGLRVENVGDTYTAYWIVMWMVANQEAIPPVVKVKAAQKQIGETVLGSDLIARGDDIKKQVVSEMLIYETMMALSMNHQVRKTGTPEQIRTLSDHAHKNMLKKGIDMRALELTADGFIAKQ